MYTNKIIEGLNIQRPELDDIHNMYFLVHVCLYNKGYKTGLRNLINYN